MAVRERYSHAKADNQKKMKRKEAEARAEQRAERTDAEQLVLLDARGLKATKERAKLQSRIHYQGKETSNGG